MKPLLLYSLGTLILLLTILSGVSVLLTDQIAKQPVSVTQCRIELVAAEHLINYTLDYGRGPYPHFCYETECPEVVVVALGLLSQQVTCYVREVERMQPFWQRHFEAFAAPFLERREAQCHQIPHICRYQSVADQICNFLWLGLAVDLILMLVVWLRSRLVPRRNFRRHHRV